MTRSTVRYRAAQRVTDVSRPRDPSEWAVASSEPKVASLSIKLRVGQAVQDMSSLPRCGRRSAARAAPEIWVSLHRPRRWHRATAAVVRNRLTGVSPRIAPSGVIRDCTLTTDSLRNLGSPSRWRVTTANECAECITRSWLGQEDGWARSSCEAV